MPQVEFPKVKLVVRIVTLPPLSSAQIGEEGVWHTEDGEASVITRGGKVSSMPFVIRDSLHKIFTELASEGRSAMHSLPLEVSESIGVMKVTAENPQDSRVFSSGGCVVSFHLIYIEQ